MSTSVLLRGRHSLVDEILNHLDLSSGVLSDCLVIFPGKRPSHFLRRAIARHKQTSFIPPRIFSMDIFVEFLYSERLGYDARLLESIESVGLLYQWYPEIIAPMIKSPDRYIEDFVPLGLRLMEDLEELRINNLSSKRLSQSIADLPLAETHVLNAIYTDFYDRLAQNRYCTRASRYKTVADNASLVNLAEFRRVIVAGFFGPTICEIEIFRSLASRDNVVFIYQDGPGMDRHLKALDLRPDIKSGPEHKASLCFYKAGDTHSQVFGMNAVLADFLNAREVPDEVAIVLPRPESLFPVIRQTALAGRDPEKDYNIALGYPIARTPIYGFFQSLFDLLGSRHKGLWHLADYVKFILHPYTKNIRFGQRSDVTRILFHTVEEWLIEDSGRAFIELEFLESDPTLRDAVTRRLKGLEKKPPDGRKVLDHLKEVHTHLLRRFDGVHNVHQMAEACWEVLVFVSEKSTAHRHPLFAKFCDEFLSALGALRESSIGSYACRDIKGYWSLLAHHLSARQIPFTGTPLKGVQVLDILETRNLTFETVFLMDANDDRLPGHPSPGSFLPTRLRETIGLPTYYEKEMTSRYYFELLVGQAQQAHIFFVEEGQQERSRFVEKRMWEEQKATGHAPVVFSLQHGVRLNNETPEPLEKTPAMVEHLKKLTYSATALNAYLTCPIQFYYTHALGLRERDPIDVEPDQYRVGSFVHAILKEYFAPFLGQVLVGDSLSEEKLDRLVSERFEEAFGRENTAGRMILKHQIASQLQSFLRTYQKPKIHSNRTVLRGLEERLQCTLNGYDLVGTIDRIEERNEETYLIDYKTGSNASAYRIVLKNLIVDDRLSWNPSIGSLQLPFYQLLYSASKGVPSGRIQPVFMMLGKQQLDEDIEVALYKDGASREDYANLERVIFLLLDEITDIRMPFRATEKIQEHCPECPFKYLCGTQWARSWRE